MRQHKISIIILGWNNDEELETCLGSLPGPLNNNDEVIVVNNRAPGNLLKVCEKLNTPVQWIIYEGRMRFSSATNLGIKACTGDFVLLLNADWRIQENALAPMLQCMTGDPAIGAVSGQLLNSDGTVQIGYNVRRFPTAFTFASDFLVLHKIFPGNAITRRHRMLDYDHRQARAVDVAISCALLIRRTVWEEIGPFDEDLGPVWIEDMDFCLRMKKAGYTLWYCPAAKFVHIDSEKKFPRGATTKHLVVWEDHTLFYRSYLRYSRKYFGRFAAVALRICIAFGMIVRIVFSGFTPRPLRMKVSRSFKLYDPDDVVRKYRRVYWHTLSGILDWSA